MKVNFHSPEADVFTFQHLSTAASFISMFPFILEIHGKINLSYCSKSLAVD